MLMGGKDCPGQPEQQPSHVTRAQPPAIRSWMFRFTTNQPQHAKRRLLTLCSRYHWGQLGWFFGLTRQCGLSELFHEALAPLHHRQHTYRLTSTILVPVRCPAPRSPAPGPGGPPQSSKTHPPFEPIPPWPDNTRREIALTTKSPNRNSARPSRPCLMKMD